MSKKSAVYLAACVGVIAFVATLFLPAFVEMPVLYYRPVEHDWTFAVHASGIAMDFFGRCLMAMVVSSSVTWAAYAAVRRMRGRELSPSGVAVLCVWAVSIVIIAIAFVAWRQEHRNPVPAPLPSCEQPL